MGGHLPISELYSLGDVEETYGQELQGAEILLFYSNSIALIKPLFELVRKDFKETF